MLTLRTKGIVEAPPFDFAQGERYSCCVVPDQYLGEHPSLTIGTLLETHQHDIGDILHESLTHEREALLEEYARRMVFEEEMHQDEVDKMLRKSGDIGAFSGMKLMT